MALIIESKDIHKTEYREGIEYEFRCPKCDKIITICYWEKQYCKCGYRWMIKQTLEAIGEKE